jgi:hypothetical protein
MFTVLNAANICFFTYSYEYLYCTIHCVCISAQRNDVYTECSPWSVPYFILLLYESFWVQALFRHVPDYQLLFLYEHFNVSKCYAISAIAEIHRVGWPLKGKWWNCRKGNAELCVLKGGGHFEQKSVEHNWKLTFFDITNLELILSSVLWRNYIKYNNPKRFFSLVLSDTIFFWCCTYSRVRINCCLCFVVLSCTLCTVG